MTEPTAPLLASPKACLSYPTREEAEVLLGLTKRLQDLGALEIIIGPCHVIFEKQPVDPWAAATATPADRETWRPLTAAEIESA